MVEEVVLRGGRFDIVAADDPRLRGRPCVGGLQGNTWVFLIAKGEMTPDLRDQLNGYIAAIVASSWAAADGPAGRRIAECRYEAVHAGALPHGRLCYPIEVDREWVFLIAEGAMSDACRVEVNAHMAAVTLRIQSTAE